LYTYRKIRVKEMFSVFTKKPLSQIPDALRLPVVYPAQAKAFSGFESAIETLFEAVMADSGGDQVVINFDIAVYN
jgi:hypothetical protein